MKENFFRPLHMDTADYFLTPAVEQKLTKLYHSDGKTPYRYWHILMRPAGAINASAREMANYVRFFLNRGSVDGMALVTPAAIERMETPATTLAAKAGMRAGYGLSNYTTIEDGFVFHGHNGGVEGGLTELAYLPGEGIGYVFMINAGNGGAFERIGKLMRSYVTKDLKKPPLPGFAPVNADLVRPFLGYLEPVTPRSEVTRFLDRLLGIRKLTMRNNRLALGPMFGKRKDYLAVSDILFRQDQDPVATLALIARAPDGPVVQTSGTTFRPVPAALVWLEFGLGSLSLVAMSSAVLFALVWVPRMLLGRLRGAPWPSLRVVPLVSVLSLAGAVGLVMVSDDQVIWRFGNLTVWSGGFFVLTLAFALTALAGLVLVIRARGAGVRRGVYVHALAVSLAATLVAAYLAYWGLIGYRSWS